MTSFATCAYFGCDERIPYEPREDKRRPRYCKCHMKAMAAWLGDHSSYDALSIKVKPKPEYMLFLKDCS